MIIRRIIAIVAATAAGTALAVASPLAASARDSRGADAGAPIPKLLNSQVVGPFQLSVDHGHLYVADGGTSLVSRLDGTTLKTVIKGPFKPGTGDVAGLDVTDHGDTIAYTATNYVTHQSRLVLHRKGHKDTVVDLAAYERKNNPDKNTTYGVDHPSACVIAAFKKIGERATYKGGVDSHPYAVADLGHGSWAVADAAANAILKVDRDGKISVIKVLPRQPYKITEGAAKVFGLAKCVIGKTYNFEPVPTDVEVGDHGWLYVTTLPGGPESSALGGRGSVYRIDRHHGDTERVATGFFGATNLALGDHGTIYVTELFGNRISTVHRGRPLLLVKLTSALSLDFARGWLYAGTLAPLDKNGNPKGHGKLYRIDVSH